MARTRVKLVSQIGDGSYGGIHCYAARELRISFPHPCSVILLDKTLPKKARADTLKHELIERELMRIGMKYRKAHRLTEKIEKMSD